MSPQRRRMAGLLIGVSPLFPAGAAIPGSAAFAAASWVFAMAVYHRWRVTVAARELASRYEADPNTEIRHLTRTLHESATR